MLGCVFGFYAMEMVKNNLIFSNYPIIIGQKEFLTYKKNGIWSHCSDNQRIYPFNFCS